MLHKLLIGTSRFLFTTFILILLGYFVALIAMNFLTGYIDTNGVDNFMEQFETLVMSIFSM